MIGILVVYHKDAAIALRRSVVGLLEGNIPAVVNTSILVPVYKGGSRMVFASYRDVHVLTCLLQIACALVASQLRRRLLCEGCIHEGCGGYGKRSNPVSQAMTAWEVLSMWVKEKDKCHMSLPQGSYSLTSYILRLSESRSAALWGETKRVVNGMKRGRACGVDGMQSRSLHHT